MEKENCFVDPPYEHHTSLNNHYLNAHIVDIFLDRSQTIQTQLVTD